MKIPSLLFVADRGRFLTYTLDRTASRPRLDLIDVIELDEGRRRLGEQLTDRAGSFPVAGTGGQANGAAERMTLTAELEMRTFRDLAEQIILRVEERLPDTWGFAAPSEINGAILDGLPTDVQRRLTCNVKADLTNTPPQDLLKHFEKAAT